MTFNEYTLQARKTALPSSNSLGYCLLGLAGEAGEVCNKFKKAFRDTSDNALDDAMVAEVFYGNRLTPEMRNAILLELGDALWYLSRAADMLGCSLETVALVNAAKLKQRYSAGTIKGNGDAR